MFNNTVSSICKEFTVKLEKVKQQQRNKEKAADVEANILKTKLVAVEATKYEAISEALTAENAINNINKLFGVEG